MASNSDDTFSVWINGRRFCIARLLADAESYARRLIDFQDTPKYSSVLLIHDQEKKVVAVVISDSLGVRTTYLDNPKPVNLEEDKESSST